jgi:glutamine synthetase
MDITALINAQTSRLKVDFAVSIFTASEIEFYLPGASDNPYMRAFWVDLAKDANAAGIKLHNNGDESGQDQFEVSLTMSPDPAITARDTMTLKDIIQKNCKTQGMEVTFAAKPFADQPGSGLHIHVHLTDAAGKNLFYKDDHSISPHLKHSIGGMLAWVGDCMPVFAPQQASYERFTGKGNAPLTVSWGANNRTVAVRLPDAAHENKHIELRVPGADADAGKVIAVMLAAMHYGLKHECDPGQQIYGDAALPMYNLPKLPLSLEEAMQRFEQFSPLRDYFSVSDLR